MQRLETLARAEGIEFKTADFGGVRTEADTTRILGYRDDEYAAYVTKLKSMYPGRAPIAKEKWRRIVPFGKSHHNYGAARDVQPINWPTGKSAQWAHDRLDTIAATDPELKAALRCGDDFGDEPHFELRIPLEEARRRWASRGLLRLVVTVVVVAVIAWLMRDSLRGLFSFSRI